MTPAKYNISDSIHRGDTYPGRVIARLSYKDSGNPIEIVSGRMQLKYSFSDDIAYEWSTGNGKMTLYGETVNNEVILAPIAASDTKDFKPGILNYDLEVVTSEGKTWTVIYGTVSVTKDVTR